MISPDSLITESLMSICGYNLYQYCFNNPVNMLDVDGNWPKWVENVAKAVAVVAVAVTAVVLVANPVSTAAGIAFSAACGGLVGGVMNSAVGESFLNGMIGGAISGALQCSLTNVGELQKVADVIGKSVGSAVGTIVGGAVGSGIGTVGIEVLNNIGKPESAKKTPAQIAKSAGIAAGVGMAMSLPTAYMNYAFRNPVTGLVPAWSEGYANLMSGVFGSVDDALAYDISGKVPLEVPKRKSTLRYSPDLSKIGAYRY